MRLGGKKHEPRCFVTAWGGWDGEDVREGDAGGREMREGGDMGTCVYV